MTGMNESGDSMLGMNQSTESPTTDGSIETPPVG